MQNCARCKIEIRGDKVCCPLCGGELDGTPERAAYPVLDRSVSRLSVVRVAAFCFIAVEIAMLALQISLGRLIPWAVFVMIGAPLAWLDVAMTFYFRSNAIKLVTYQTYIGMIVTIAIDRLTGQRGWSLAWLVPSCFVGLAIATICIGKGLKMRLEEYIIYLTFALGLSFLQIIFICNGWNPFRWPAVASMTILSIMGVWALLFYFRAFKNAAGKMFHV